VVPLWAHIFIEKVLPSAQQYESGQTMRHRDIERFNQHVANLPLMNSKKRIDGPLMLNRCWNRGLTRKAKCRRGLVPSSYVLVSGLAVHREPNVRESVLMRAMDERG